MYGLNGLIHAAQTGALRAQIEYSTWSGGLEVVDSGVEQFVSAKIAESIHGIADGKRKYYVSLEHPIQDLMERIQRRNPGRKGGRLESNGRIDVVVWDIAQNPILVIEVKRQFRWGAVGEDAKRVERLINKFGNHLEGGSIEAGMIVIPYVSWVGSNPDEPHPTQSTIQKVKDNAARMGFTMRATMKDEITEDHKSRMPFRKSRGDEVTIRNHIEYCSACFTIMAKDQQ